MSTTGGTAQGTVLMLDEPDVIRKKIKSAVTDSGRDVRRGEGKEGIENLITIMSVATGEPLDAIESRYDGAGYGDFKSDVAEAVVEMTRPDSGSLPRAARRPGRALSPAGGGSREGPRRLGAHACAHVRAHGLRQVVTVSSTHRLSRRARIL